jgi:hypothetical protein
MSQVYNDEDEDEKKNKSENKEEDWFYEVGNYDKES